MINTDNVSVLGITIDYGMSRCGWSQCESNRSVGPYAFMDVYDPFHICSKYAWHDQERH